jgi:hypothetical protein
VKAAPLGLHGLEIACRDPRRLASRLARAFGLTTLHATRGRVVIGTGPELSISIVAAEVEGAALTGIDVAVEDIAFAKGSPRRDELGGDSVSCDAGSGVRATVRQFRRPPSSPWRRRSSRGR